MRILLYPFAFVASWYFWLAGHIAYKVMMANDDSEEWVNHWWPSYQFNMLFSSDVQDYVGGRGFLWPWGEAYDPPRDS